MRKKKKPLEAKHPENLKGCVALVFSKDQDFLEHYRDLIAKMGFTPVTASTPEGAAGILRLMVVVFVVLDQSDPTSESRFVLERARKVQRHAPVLVIAREADQHFRHEVLAMGAVDYMDHPALSDDILRTLLVSDVSISGSSDHN